MTLNLVQISVLTITTFRPLWMEAICGFEEWREWKFYFDGINRKSIFKPALSNYTA